jgi:predicted nuclease of predicted toxin-antitoxin system
MRLLFDQNISFRILQLLPEAFFGSVTVVNQVLTDKSDREIWEFAQINGYVIVTQDSDFHDLTILYGHPPKIIWIRTGNLSTIQLA